MMYYLDKELLKFLMQDKIWLFVVCVNVTETRARHAHGALHGHAPIWRSAWERRVVMPNRRCPRF